MDGRKPRMARRTVPRERGLKESRIQQQVMDWLKVQGLLAWYVKSTGTYDPARKVFRTPPRYFRKGVPDVHFFAHGYYVQVELKTRTGRLSPEQKEFAYEHSAKRPSNCRWYVARSVEDVQDIVNQLAESPL